MEATGVEGPEPDRDAQEQANSVSKGARRESGLRIEGVLLHTSSFIISTSSESFLRMTPSPVWVPRPHSAPAQGPRLVK